MKRRLIGLSVGVLIATGPVSPAPEEIPLSSTNLQAGDPVYAVYAARAETTRHSVDEGYRLRFDDASQPLGFSTDTAGRLSVFFKRGTRIASKIGDYVGPPRILRNYSDGGRLVFSPLIGVEARLDFVVFSSSFLIAELRLHNQTESEQEISVAFLYQRAEPVKKAMIAGDSDVVFFTHQVSKDRMPPGVKLARGDLDRENVLMLSRKAEGWAGYESQTSPFIQELRKESLNQTIEGDLRAFAMASKLKIKAGRKKSLRVVRGVGLHRGLLWTEGTKLLFNERFERILRRSARSYSGVPKLTAATENGALVYWQAFSLLDQTMMPSGPLPYSFFVSSREPVWRKGHRGQSMDEAIGLLAYVHMNPKAAMDSLRFFMAAQRDDGFIAQRLGPTSHLAKKLKDPPAATPLLSWLCWEVFRTTGEVGFLEEAYESGSRFADFLMRTRDRDGDGLYEWIHEAESGRAGSNVLWRALGSGPESVRDVEALDLNCFLARELGTLSEMANRLGKRDAAQRWKEKAAALAASINENMWDPESGFYYHIDRDSNSFRSRKGVDLRRMEIIGFLPLWAGIVPKERMQALLRHFDNPSRFGRPRGVPSLSADDPGYDAVPSGCCNWAGPVRMNWNYLVFQGLLENGYRDRARTLADRNLKAASERLGQDHSFPESYNPDGGESRGLSQYFASGILARVLIDLDRP